MTTGILDHPDALTVLPNIFLKTLTYCLFIDLENLDLSHLVLPTVHQSIIEACWKKLPVKWLEFLNNGRHKLPTPLGQSEEDQKFMLVTVFGVVVLLGISKRYYFTYENPT